MWSPSNAKTVTYSQKLKAADQAAVFDKLGVTMCRPSLQPHGLLWLKHDGMRLLCRSWFASSSHAFPHISALHIWLQHSTAERRDECCRGSFATWRPGLAEGLGRPCLWQSHCLKLQEISWATAAARRWYGSFPKFTAGLQSGSSGSLVAMTGRCVYSCRMARSRRWWRETSAVLCC